MRIEKTVFLSYRRTSIGWALAIYQNLTHDGYDVFFDYEGIASGDFEHVILDSIRARAHFLVLLTPSALERVDEPGDWLRREIEVALESKRNIVPLMLEGFSFSSPAIAKHLSGSLAPLRRYNALSVPNDYFREAMARLREKHLNVPLDAVIHPVSRTAGQAVEVQQSAASAAPAVKALELSAEQWFEQGFQASALEDKERYYSEAIRLKPDYAHAYNNRGNAREVKRDIDGALKDFAEAIRLKPDYALAYNNRGIVRKRQGDIDGALKDFAEAIRLKPDYAPAYNNRGFARGDRGDLDGALKDYTEAIRLKPDYALAYNNRGLARKGKGDLDGALKDYTEAIRLKPDYFRAYFNRGVVRKGTGDLDGALKDFTEAIRLKPDYARAYFNRGVVRDDEGDIEGTLRDYTEAIRFNPDYGIAYSNRGNVRQRKGDVDGALQDYGEAIRLKPDHANAYHNRAILKSGQADNRAAIADFQKYLDLGGGIRAGNQATVEDIIRKLSQAAGRQA